MRHLIIPTIMLITLFSSCVSIKKLEGEQARTKTLQFENQALMEELEKTALLKARLEEENEDLKRNLKLYEDSTAMFTDKYIGERNKNEELNKLYDDLVNQNKKLLSSSSSEKQRLLSELENQKRALLEKEQQLNEEKAKIDRLNKELEAREQRVQELQDLVDKKDAAIANLKKRIEDALLGFDKDELTVEMRDGKLYVSLSEKLLFKSGSAAVDAKGKDALEKLAGVLAKQTDVEILVEGHTDDDPISTACVKDNWDLSVLRATSIVRILKENKDIKPSRFIASGRGEFVPVASNDNSEGKSKNRRTEIILAPNLNEIFKILESSN